MDAYTENLADFGYRERKIAAELLAAELPQGFDGSGVRHSTAIADTFSS